MQGNEPYENNAAPAGKFIFYTCKVYCQGKTVEGCKNTSHAKYDDECCCAVKSWAKSRKYNIYQTCKNKSNEDDGCTGR